MISNRCARKSLVTNCNSIISKNYLRFLVDSNDYKTLLTYLIVGKTATQIAQGFIGSPVVISRATLKRKSCIVV